jgi:hypothetical protein
MSELPYVCPEHPGAKIRHEWNQTQYTRREGWPMGEPIKSDHHYFCNICNRELAATRKETPHEQR